MKIFDFNTNAGKRTLQFLKKAAFRHGLFVLESILGAHEKAVRCVCYSPESNVLITGSWDSTIKIWDLRTMRCVGCHQQPERVYSMAITGDRLLVATAGRKVWIWNIRNLGAGPEQKRDSSLKYQTRCIRAFPNGQGFVLSSIEGMRRTSVLPIVSSLFIRGPLPSRSSRRRIYRSKSGIAKTQIRFQMPSEQGRKRPRNRLSRQRHRISPSSQHIRHGWIGRLGQHLGSVQQEALVSIPQIYDEHQRLGFQRGWIDIGYRSFLPVRAAR